MHLIPKNELEISPNCIYYPRIEVQISPDCIYYPRFEVSTKYLQIWQQHRPKGRLEIETGLQGNCYWRT